MLKVTVTVERDDKTIIRMVGIPRGRIVWTAPTPEDYIVLDDGGVLHQVRLETSVDDQPDILEFSNSRG